MPLTPRGKCGEIFRKENRFSNLLLQLGRLGPVLAKRHFRHALRPHACRIPLPVVKAVITWRRRVLRWVWRPPPREAQQNGRSKGTKDAQPLEAGPHRGAGKRPGRMVPCAPSLVQRSSAARTAASEDRCGAFLTGNVAAAQFRCKRSVRCLINLTRTAAGASRSTSCGWP